jgi:hypothetical protein
MKLYIGLVHYPVYNKNRQTVASAVTNFDLHDISRVARTYGVKKLFVITPLTDQQKLAERIRRHWTIGFGAKYNPTRKDALELMAVVPSLEESIKEVKEMEGEPPVLIVTDASKQIEKSITYSKAIDIIDSKRVVMVLFGTAWGLEQEVFRKADYVLEPIEGGTDYNHLSVRSAAAIILDRLAGRFG